MLAHAPESLRLFALVWLFLCIVASALVTDILLRDTASRPE